MLDAGDLLNMLNPTTTPLQGTNPITHTVSFDDVRIALALLKGMDARAAQDWEHLVIFLTDEVDIMDRNTKCMVTFVEDACAKKRLR